MNERKKRRKWLEREQLYKVEVEVSLNSGSSKGENVGNTLQKMISSKLEYTLLVQDDVVEKKMMKGYKLWKEKDKSGRKIKIKRSSRWRRIIH